MRIRWLARLAANRGVSLALIVAVVAVDHWIRRPGMSFVQRALLDEPCHVATAVVVIGAITRFRGSPPDSRFLWSMLACSVLIDADHLPLEFGSSVLTNGTPRPYTHALWVVLLLTVAAIIARCWSRHARTLASGSAVAILAGAAWGISAHFLRDIVTAEISPWWPVSSAAAQVPYWWYVLALLITLAIPRAPAAERYVCRSAGEDLQPRDGMHGG